MGQPVHDDKKLFEMLALSCTQAGLSWITMLRKRENYRRAFDGFDVERIACYDDAKLDELLHDAGIIRNRQKISAELKKRGFKFVGSTIVCAYMHTVGLMNGHMRKCFCRTGEGIDV